MYTIGNFRIVFDRTTRYNGVSLNDKLMKGPNLPSTLIGVRSRFRRFKFKLVTDIKKMYYQCIVDDEDQDFRCYFCFIVY